MPIAILAAVGHVDEVGPERGTASELGMVEIHTGVNDPGRHAVAREVVAILAVERQVALVDTVEAPGRVELRIGYRDTAAVDHLAHLDVGHIVVGRDGVGGRGWHPSGKALEHMPVGEQDLRTVGFGELPSQGAYFARCNVFLEHDNVFAFDGLGGLQGERCAFLDTVLGG